jgi:RNA polymerase sigma-70 factor (ECF subfamily)
MDQYPPQQAFFAADRTLARQDDTTGVTKPETGVDEHLRLSDEQVQQDGLHRLGALLDTLPQQQREAIRLRHFERMPLEAIANNLGITPTAAAGLLRRGLMSLHNKLTTP